MIRQFHLKSQKMASAAHLFRIRERALVVLLARLRRTAVRPEDVVLGVDSDRLGEEVDGLIIVLRSEGLVALVFQRICLCRS